MRKAVSMFTKYSKCYQSVSFVFSQYLSKALVHGMSAKCQRSSM